MKRVLAASVLVTAFAAIGLASAGAASAAPIGINKGRHDVCIGTMDPDGTLHPIVCINPPPFKPAP